MLIVITEAVQDLQTVQHAPIVRVVPIVPSGGTCGVCSGGSSKKKRILSGLFKKKSSGGSRNLKSGYSKVI